MAPQTLELRGCTPEPLGNYLKGLGVFRLIGEQADPQARAWWKDGVLVLHTKWSKEELVSFFVNGIGAERAPIYSPTPIFAPWGGRPGFYVDGNDKARARLEALRQPDPPGRFAIAQMVVKATDDVLRNHGWTNATKKKRTDLKPSIVAAMRNAWAEAGVDWFDACLSLEEDARFGFLYGTGGNEGSADITNNFWELIEETIGASPRLDSRELLIASAFGESRVGGTSRTAGQHFPLSAGSANCGQSFFSSSSTNPWDVVLMMEGAIVFAGAVTKKLSQLGKGKAAFPFMIDHLATDGAATAIKDEAGQDAQVVRCRAEFWMPLWSSPTSLTSLRALFAEGRLQRRSGEQTEHTLHAIEAIKTLGVARGIDTLHRVALFERRGKGYYLASSLGFYPTSRTSENVAAQLSEMEDFRNQVYRNLREGPGVPNRIIQARQRFHGAIGTLFERDEHAAIGFPNGQLDILVSASRLEREVTLLKDRDNLLKPCPPLTRGWMGDAPNDGAYGLARAIAGMTAWGTLSNDGHERPAVECLRANLLSVVRPWNTWEWYDASQHKGFRNAAVWSRGVSLAMNLAAVLRRRLMDAERGVGDGLPLWSSYGAEFDDVLAFWNREIDEDRLAELIHGLALVDFGQWTQAAIENRQVRDEPTPDLQTGAVWFDANDEARIQLASVEWQGRQLLSNDNLRAAFELPRVYHLLKLCFVGGHLPRRPVEGQTVPRTRDESAPPKCLDVVALLQAGRLSDAVQLVARRLRGSGYPTQLRDADLRDLNMTGDECRRLAGMLLIPIRQPGVCAALTVKPETAK
ncbi:MAG: type I-G CRISPR-associated protein Cas8g1/Csx17 [Longimicrobiales bacterium]